MGSSIGGIWDSITPDNVWDKINDGTISVFDAVANGTITAVEAIENGTLDATQAIADGLVVAMDAVDEGFVSLEYVLDEGYLTSLDVFALAVYNGTGDYYGTNKNDVIIAADILGAIPGFSWLRDIWGSGEGKIYAKDGDDTIIMASLDATVYTGSGNDSVYGGSVDLKIRDTSGNLMIGTATLESDIEKTGDGNITFAGVSGLLDIDHSGDHGDINAYSLAASNKINLSGTSGDINFYGLGASNIIEHAVTDYGKIDFYGGGGANIIRADGHHTDIDFYGAGAANILINKASYGKMNIHALGVGNLIIKKSEGNLNAYLAAAGNVVVNLADGDDRVSMLGAINTHTKVGDGDTVLAMAGGLNVATFIGDGDIYGGLLGAGNVVTKVGTGNMYVGLAAKGNVVTHIDDSNANSSDTILALGGFNVITKVGNGTLSSVMAGEQNVTTHIGAGNIYSAQLGGANILTKVGDGNVTSVQLGGSNILTQKGDGQSLAVMGGSANIFTKIGDGLTAAAMMSYGNAFTHIGHGDSYALMGGRGNIFTKIGGGANDKTFAAMFADYNVFTHVGDGLTASLMLSQGNVFTKVGDGTTIAALAANNNVATHIGNGDDYAFMVGNTNIFTKVGDTANNGQVAALMSGAHNVSTHIGDGRQINLVNGDTNVISKLGEGDQISVAVGHNNVLTQIAITGQNNGYNLAKGNNNLVTKVGDGNQVSALIGDNNLITHIGDGNTYQLAYGGTTNLITKVGDGDVIAGLIGSQYNVITQIGAGDGYYGMWGDHNVATKVGDGEAVAVMKGNDNLLTNVGDGLQVALMSGNNNINVKVGDGSSINIIHGESNLVTKTGDGLHLAAMKGNMNVNLHIGDGTTIAAMHANQNLTVKIGNGDFYGLSIAKSDASFSDNLGALLSQIKETAIGYVASDIIGQLVWGPEGTQDSESDNPDLNDDTITNPTLDTNINMTTTVVAEGDWTNAVTNVEDSTIDHSNLPEDSGNPTTVIANPDEEYGTLVDSQVLVSDGNLVQNKVAIEKSDGGLKGDKWQLIAGDYNGDGRDDFIKQKHNGTAYTYLSDGDGTFTSQKFEGKDVKFKGPTGKELSRALTDGVYNIIAGDYNGDGKDDIIRQSVDAETDDLMTVYLSVGDGTFNKHELSDNYLLHGDDNNIIAGDYNGDGRDDFIRQIDGERAHIYLSNGDGTFTSQLFTDNMGLSHQLDGVYTNLIIGDYNGDGKDDIIRQAKGDTDREGITTTVHWWGIEITGIATVYLAADDGTFNGYELPSSDLLNGDNNIIIAGDYNGDGRDDFIRQTNAQSSYVHLSNGNGTFTIQSLNHAIDSDLFNIIVGDYNGDGKDDYIKQSKGNNLSSLYLSNGNGTFREKDISDANTMRESYNNLIIGDYDGDGKDDFIKQEKGALDDDDYNTANLYFNTDGTVEGGSNAGSATASEDLDITNATASGGSSSITQSVSQEINDSITQGTNDIGSLTDKGNSLTTQADGIKTNLDSTSNTLLNYLSTISDRYAVDDNQSTTSNGDAARNDYDIGIIDVDAHLTTVESDTGAVIGNAQTTTDNAENELSEADLNATQANDDATLSQDNATIAETNANTQISQTETDANNMQTQAGNAENTALAQSNNQDINVTDNNNRTESNGSGLTINNNADQSGDNFDNATNAEVVAHQNDLLSQEDEDALAQAMQSIYNLGSNQASQNGSADPSYDPVDTSGEGVDGNLDNNPASSNSGFLESGGDFSQIAFGNRKRNAEEAGLDDNSGDLKRVNINLDSREEKEISEDLANAINQIDNGEIVLSNANENIIKEIGGKLEGTIYVKSVVRDGSGNVISVEFTEGGSLLLNDKEILKRAVNSGDIALDDATTLNNDIDSHIATSLGEINSNIGQHILDNHSTILSLELNEIGEKFDYTQPEKSNAKLSNELKDIISNTTIEDYLSASDRGGRGWASSDLYRQAYEYDPSEVETSWSKFKTEKWHELTAERGLHDANTKVSINHILSDAHIKVLIANAAVTIHNKLLAGNTVGADADLNNMRSFFDKMAGMDQFNIDGVRNVGFFSDTAMYYFEGALTNTDGTIPSHIDIKYLDYSVAAISYAPGNIRYGDQSLNSSRSSNFDPIFEKVVDANDNVVEVRLSESTTEVKEAVELLRDNNIVDKTIANKSLATDVTFKTGHSLYSTSKIKEVNQDGTDSSIGDSYIIDSTLESKLSDGLKDLVGYSAHNARFNPNDALKAVLNNDEYYTAQKFNNSDDALWNKVNFTGSESLDPSNRSHSHDLAKNEDGTLIQNADGTFKTKLTDKDPNYKAIDQGNDLVVYEYTDSDGEISYRVVNTAKEYSIYMKTPPVIDASGNLDLSGRAALTFGHGEKTGTTYTKDSGSPASSFFGDDNKILQSSPLGLIDKDNQAEIDKTSAGAVVDDYKLTKPREEFLASEDQYQKKHLDQTMHATIGNMGANDIVIVPGKYSDLTRQGLESDLSSYGVTDNRMHVCRGDDPAQVHTLTISDSVKDMASDIKSKILDNIEGSTSDTKSTSSNIDSDVNNVKNNAPAIDSDGSNSRQVSYESTDTTTPNSGNNQEATKGNIQLQVGDGEYVAGFWGDNNLGLKVGTGGFKGAAFGENNILAHIGDAGDNVSYSTTIGGYDAFEGAQLLIGSKNLSFNYGDSNDFIVAIDKSIPLPPFVSPFSGPSNIVGYLKDQVVTLGEETDGARGEDFYYKQSQLWSYGQAESIINNVSGLDQNSAVYYESIFDYGSETDRDTRALQADIEASLNKEFNNWMSPGGDGDQGGGDTQANIVIAGQGADIIMANGENQFLFGDNIQSVLDTTLSSLFGMMTQDAGANGMPTSTFSYDPTKLPQKLKDQLLNVVAVSLPEITLGDIFTIDYNANGSIYKSDGASVSGSEMLDVLEVIAQFGNQTITKYADPDMIMDNIKSSLSLADGAADQIKTTFGIQEVPGEASNPATSEAGGSASGETLGFGGLTLPSIFNMADISNSFSSIPDLINDLAGTINGFGGDANNIQNAIIEFFTTSGYMTDDGDLMVSLGDSNYSWGGHGNDIGAFLGLNNNFWGGRGDDMLYGLGENNQASGNEGNDTGILLGLNNLFLGGEGDDFALASGRLNNLSGGTGNDSLFAFGSDTWLMGDEGDDYLMSAGIFTTIQAGTGNDYVVSTGHYANINGEEGKDAISIFGNDNNVLGGDDGDMIRILGHQSTADGESGDDLITLDVKAKTNLVKGGDGDDNFVLGGYDNTVYGGLGRDQFLVNHNVINNTVKDISIHDFILFEDLDYSELWLERQGDDLEIYVDRGFTDEELSATQNLINEAIGLVSFEDYFLNNTANIAVSYENSDNYVILNSLVIDQLIAVMDNYEIDVYDDSFFANVSFDDETLILDAWQDTRGYLAGDETDNILYSYGENNFLYGKGGDDTIFSASAADTIDGGEGIDYVYYTESTSAVSVNLATNVNQGGYAQGDILSNIENISGSYYDDHLTGDSANNDIYGQIGDDTIIGGLGNDSIYGGIGHDIIDGNEGNDDIYGGDGDDIIRGGAGNDILVADAGIDIIDGGTGNDTIYGKLGTNTLNGDEGDDAIYSGAGIDTIDGGTGIDFVRYDRSTSAVIVNLATNVNQDGYAQGDILSNIENISGSDYDDDLTGDSANNYIYAGDGDDIIREETGNNFLYGEDGNDRIVSGSGSDTIDGGTGADFVYYTQSTSGVTVNLETNVNQGGYAQGDILSNIERVAASNYDDNITGDSASNSIYGYIGDDIINGGSGIDYLHAGSGNDSIYGGTGNDYIYGGSGNNFLYGEDGNDIIFSGSGSDTIDGGVGGADFVYYSNSTSGVTVNLETNVNQGGYAQGDLLFNIKNINGSSYDDDLTGDSANNYIYGKIGDDTINGGLGNDSIYAGVGNDSIYGGLGNDFIHGESGNNFLYGEDGNDIIFSGSGSDTIDGGVGADFVYYINSTSGVTVNLETNVNQGGYAQGDLLFNIKNINGSSYDDDLTGDSANNYIYGKIGDDTINGGLGTDNLIGGVGSDNLTGGAGSDTFHFGSLADSTINSSDLITDFTQGEDTINLSDLNFTGITSDQSQTDDQLLTYEYDSGANQTIVSNEAESFEFKLSGNIALNANDFDFIA